MSEVELLPTVFALDDDETFLKECGVVALIYLR